MAEVEKDMGIGVGVDKLILHRVFNLYRLHFLSLAFKN